ncbi:hypothetical protein [Alkalicoccus daliensis]|uniref:DUF2834 domain-containing protein n=1 Tax=Alkalicoccus daliensis TaxID=745820 RepID=A0A1H0KSZ0_9BACI|nr:hypothetical protein [Alkalicoccus daliensis]SDO58891.1 hypothetical protein SAMN04488053_1202 [Alkalicoccus daliensis]
MKKRFAVVFVLLVSYAVFLAPGGENGGGPTFPQLITGQFEGVDPLVTAVFSMLGIYPVIFALLLIPKDRYRLPAWPFVLLSFGLGAFSILPYMAFRGSRNKETARGPRLLHHGITHPLLLILLLIISIAVYLVGIAGSFSAYGEAFMNSGLVSVMTIDFLVVIWLTYYILRYDWQLRHTWLTFIPAIGPLILILWRNKLSVPHEKLD